MSGASSQKAKIGLVLEGGAMRGLFTAGILDVWMEQGLTFDGAIGVSAGAVFGCNLKTGQIGRSIRYNLAYCRDPRYASFRSLLLTGDLFGADFCYRRIPEELDVYDLEAHRQNPMPFYVLATDVDSGEAVCHLCEQGNGDDLLWMRASASMPLVSRAVEVGGRRLLDGGMADSIPLKRFQAMGFEKNLLILTQPRDFVKQPSSLFPLMRLALRKYPKLLETMARRHTVYNDSLAYVRREEEAGRVLVLAPDEKLNIKRVDHDPAHLQAVYELGRKKGEDTLMQVKAFLENGPYR